MFHSILVAVDGSRDADEALSQAIDLAESEHTRLTLIMAVPEVPAAASMTPGSAALIEDPRPSAEAALRAACDRVPADLPVTTILTEKPIRTALRERVPLVSLIWVDDEYGLIKWKMDLELGESFDTAFGNPDFVAYAESFGARGYLVRAADELLPTLERALADGTVSVIACPVDYSANLQLTDALGELDESLS